MSKKKKSKQNRTDTQKPQPKGTVVWMDCGDTMVNMELPFFLGMNIPKSNNSNNTNPAIGVGGVFFG